MINRKAVLYIFAAFSFSALLFWGCIKEDDGIPPALDLPVITFEDQTIEEGDTDDTIQVVMTLTGENKTNAIVTFSAVPAVALSGIDYEVLTASPLIFAPGETSKTIAVRIVGDEVKEAKETFAIKAFNPQNVYLSKDNVIITIEDDDDNAAGLVIPTTGFTTPTEYPGKTLVWADEFNADTLNTSNWSYELGAGGWGNNELQYYREDNTSLIEGNLVITAKKQDFGGSEYTSSRLVTKGKKFFKFGRIDIRAALPEGQGLWPALWMLGTNIDAVSWPACGEIDIMELTGNLPNRVVGTVHYGANTSEHQYNSMSKYLSGDDNFQDEFHVFSINWIEDKIEFLVDDVIFHTITPADLDGAAYPFNKNFFFIFNIAVGGNFPGNPDNSTPFPQHMIVDYVRVFQ